MTRLKSWLLVVMRTLLEGRPRCSESCGASFTMGFGETSRPSSPALIGSSRSRKTTSTVRGAWGGRSR